MNKKNAIYVALIIVVSLNFGSYLSSGVKSGNKEDPPIDFDKSLYFETVKIGNQIWMTKNLDLSSFRNGDPIPESKSIIEWRTARDERKPAWCYYEFDASKGEKYGKLYNWYAISDIRGLAPRGWHIPSQIEWIDLTEILGGKNIAGLKMKSSEGWYNNGNGTNESGFTAIPGGYCTTNGSFYGLYENAHFWSSREIDDNYVLSRTLKSSSNYLSKYEHFKANGHSVRCIKDK